MKSDCPCYGCVAPKRSGDCHCKCKEYDAWRKKEQEKTSAINEQKQIELLISDYHTSAVAKVKKGSRRR